jgi:ubiquitin-conjugating enzyme E2 D/E
MNFDKQSKKWPKIMLKKFQNAKKSDLFKIVQIDENSLDAYYILLQPTGGHYKGHIYILEMKTRHSTTCLFPFTPPLIKFVNKIWHPNISVNGSICLDILKNPDKWSAQNSIETLISSIILLMDCPENSDPFNAEAVKIFKLCEKKYKDAIVGLNICNQTNELYNECFKPYDLKTRNFASCKIDHYIQYFVDDLSKNLDEIKLDT